LSESESLGWLVSFVLRPDPTRLVPSPPFDAEVEVWQKLVASFQDRLNSH
ncbi:primosomal protein, partial [Kibdelosporangium lantanae]